MKLYFATSNKHKFEEAKEEILKHVKETEEEYYYKVIEVRILSKGSKPTK